jgi:G6PDH family F420-dependent oxidoreductase
MPEIGYSLSSEEFGPNRLVELAKRAEDAGFGFGMVSDHFHPWIRRQGHSPFVWPVVGGIAQATRRFLLGTGVTCPLIRIHPAIIAQAAATAACMMQGRFMLGLGTGENLNEHVTGARWPGTIERLEMLREAIDLIRLLLNGGNHTRHGKHYTVQDAEIFTLPDTPLPILVAAANNDAAELAGEMGDGLVSTKPDKGMVEAFHRAGGSGKPKYGQLTVCWARTEADARRTAHEIWPTSALSGINQELPSPYYFEEAAKAVDEEQVAQRIICGPDPRKHIEAIQKYLDVGFDHIYVHQVGEDQEGFMQFYAHEILGQFVRMNGRRADETSKSPA